MLHMIHVYMYITYKYCYFMCYLYLIHKSKLKVKFYFLGFWWFNPRSWWHYGQIRLSIFNGNFRSCLSFEFYQVKKFLKKQLRNLLNISGISSSKIVLIYFLMWTFWISSDSTLFIAIMQFVFSKLHYCSKKS